MYNNIVDIKEYRPSNDRGSSIKCSRCHRALALDDHGYQIELESGEYTHLCEECYALCIIQ